MYCLQSDTESYVYLTDVSFYCDYKSSYAYHCGAIVAGPPGSLGGLIYLPQWQLERRDTIFDPHSKRTLCLPTGQLCILLVHLTIILLGIPRLKNYCVRPGKPACGTVPYTFVPFGVFLKILAFV